VKLYDFTSLDCLARCPEEWYRRFVQHLAKPEPDASALFGQIVHVGVRSLFEGAPPEVVNEQMLVAWGDFVPPSKKAYLMLAYAQNMVNGYREAYFGKDAIQPFEPVLNEHYLEWPERQLCGIVDRVVRAKVDGQLYVMDLKTTGLYLSEAWLTQWRHSLQAAIYLDLVEHELGKPIAGFWVDVVHVNKRSYAKPSDFMRVGPFAYSPEVRAELRATAAALTEQAETLVKSNGARNKNPRNCFRYSSLCSFFEYCNMVPADREDAYEMALASGELGHQIWEPSKR